MRNDKAVFVGIGMLMIATLAEPARAQAQEPPDRKPATPPSVGPGTDHLDLSVGGGVVLAPRPYVGASEAVIPIPVFNVRYKRLFAEGIRGGAQFLRQGKLTGNVYLQANFEGLKADDSPYLAGMENRSTSADAGVEVVYRARPVGFRVNVLTDVLGRNSGQEFSMQAVTGAPLGSRGFLLASIGPRWISANRVDYNYGVRESEATPDRPAYKGTSLDGRRRLEAEGPLRLLALRRGLGPGQRPWPGESRPSRVHQSVFVPG